MAPTPTSQRRWPTYVGIGCALILVCVCAAAAAVAAYNYVRSRRAATAEPTVEYILDASPRMQTASTGGDTRLAVARGVLADIVRTADPRLTAGLRVFGTGALPQGCRDTDLLVPFAPANQDAIEGSLGGVAAAPQSDSPVAEAMISAIKDMASTAGPHSMVVVTGGADSCNPESGVLIQQEAERAGIELKVFVIGFEVPPDEVEAVRALVELLPGATYLDAPDPASLRRQLGQVQTDVNRRAAEAFEEAPPTSAPRAAESACDHPYFPLRSGATWTYSSPEGSVTFNVGGASGGSVTMTISAAGFTFDTHWNCTSEGIVSYDFSFSGSEFGAGITLDVSETSGTWLPRAEEMTPGASWSNGYTTHVTTSTGGISFDVTSRTDETWTVTGTETVSVPAGTFEAVRVDGTSTTTFTGDFPVAVPPSSSQFTYWFAEGVGLVRYVYSSGDYSGGGDLTAYSVP